MDLSVQVASDASLQFRTPAHTLIASLSPGAVTALTNLAQVPPEANPIVHRHVQRIVQQLPDVRDQLAHLGLSVAHDDDTIRLTDAGQRLATWLVQSWKPWSRYIRHIPPDALTAWRWEVTYETGHIDRL